jgi:SAM-dependent methyltransferase
MAKAEKHFHAALIPIALPPGKVLDGPMSDEPDLSAALALTGPEATRALYRAWADSYDTGFARDMEYRLPAHVAAAFLAAGGRGPVLDVGAGTGLLAESLRRMGLQDRIDALDLSAEMLDRAARKGLYTRLFRADVTQRLDLPPIYGGLTSSGTFTAGHVGPQAFGPMLDVALPGALFALSINQRVWTEAGFDTALAELAARGLIRDLHLIEVQIYGPAAAALDPSHAGDRASVALFRKA